MSSKRLQQAVSEKELVAVGRDTTASFAAACQGLTQGAAGSIVLLSAAACHGLQHPQEVYTQYSTAPTPHRSRKLCYWNNDSVQAAALSVAAKLSVRPAQPQTQCRYLLLVSRG